MLDVKLTPQLLSMPGALTAVDKLVTTVVRAHRADDPAVENGYNSVHVKIWDDDDSVRQGIKWAAERARKAAREGNDD